MRGTETWRRRLAAFAIPLSVVVAAMAMSAMPARADFRVCNTTQGLVGVAIGYRTAEGWKTEGWWQIDGDDCKTIIEGPLLSRFYYLYAEDSNRGGRWGGPVNMCVMGDAFDIKGVEDCFARGFQRAGFKEYDTGEQSSWMVQLTDDQAGQEPMPPAPVEETPPAPAEETPPPANEQ